MIISGLAEENIVLVEILIQRYRQGARGYWNERAPYRFDNRGFRLFFLSLLFQDGSSSKVQMGSSVGGRGERVEKLSNLLYLHASTTTDTTLFVMSNPI